MSRLLYRDELFYELAPSALQEFEFEAILMQNANVIRANSVIVPYKRTLYSADQSAKADLALINVEYRNWCVIEVELIQHSLRGHVIPQIRTLRDAAYGPDDAIYLAQKASALEASKLAEMIRGEQPSVLVIVNKPNEEWGRELRRYDAHMMVFEIYRSDKNRHIFRVDGELPHLIDEVISHCRLDDVLPRTLIVSSPAVLQVAPGGMVEISVEGKMTRWRRVDTKTHCYLMAFHRVELQRGERYVIVRSGDRRLSIEPSS